ncbi:type I-F CRISPR-associated protein Csy3 [Diaphorobacter ruginosibacter]|uniref:Type I-F CRISPR-associated protein Csy3 n=1 Tax=Diaphorobacter ruginosibacter TaxID=1715720 RepID=A0A7G9RMU1_9BURK|nr:type I-F CRISPR-associated protein Csy3 [Diaphorobacter ruginosibacter]QNN56916.1 type I-F CRISPR-associated protein Csy3 [Diaphorobacter ruginosibacter]
MSNTSLKTASVLAFERKLDPSDATFHAGQWAARDSAASWEPVRISTKSVRGTISNRLKAKDQDPARLDASIEKPNLQTVDVAALPATLDTLKVQFTLRVLAGTGTPSACNSAEYQAKLQQTVQGYVQQQGFAELGLRYAANLANARFLWRNRHGAEEVQVQIARLRNGLAETTWMFDSLAQGIRTFDAGNTDLQALGALIADGLAGRTDPATNRPVHVLLQVTAFVRMGMGQEVFPSQELILERGDKSKTLYQVDGVASIHSQKIGNAIRTIDTWYENAQKLGPIAVEPYGSVTTQGKAYRQPKQKLDFYTLLDDWLLKDKVPAIEQQHFVMAVLIRGGVFGDAN